MRPPPPRFRRLIRYHVYSDMVVCSGRYCIMCEWSIHNQSWKQSGNRKRPRRCKNSKTSSAGKPAAKRPLWISLACCRSCDKSILQKRAACSANFSGGKCVGTSLASWPRRSVSCAGPNIIRRRTLIGDERARSKASYFTNADGLAEEVRLATNESA